ASKCGARSSAGTDQLILALSQQGGLLFGLHAVGRARLAASDCSGDRLREKPVLPVERGEDGKLLTDDFGLNPGRRGLKLHLQLLGAKLCPGQVSTGL